MNTPRFLALASLCAMLTGCDSEWSLFGGHRSSIAGASAMIDPKIEVFDQNRLATLVAGGDAKLDDPYALEKAVQTWNDRAEQNAGAKDAKTDDALIRRRNEVQDALMLASDQRCEFYERGLRRWQANTDALSGVLGTGLGAAGAIVTSQTGSRILSGLAAAAVGIGQAEEKGLFAGVASSVIIPGIESRRRTIKQEIMDKGCSTPTQYTIYAAMQDAMIYHSACAMDVGLKEAGKAVDESSPNTVGLDEIAKVKKILASTGSDTTGSGDAGQKPDDKKPDDKKKVAADAGTKDGKTDKTGGTDKTKKTDDGKDNGGTDKGGNDDSKDQTYTYTAKPRPACK